MRRVWMAMLLCAGCGSAQATLQPEAPASVWARPVASSEANAAAKAKRQAKSAVAAPSASASAAEPGAQLSPERLATSMVSALDRQASLEEQERRSKQQEDDARMRRTMDQLQDSMGMGGLGTRGGTTLGGGTGIGLGGIGAIGRGGGGGLSTGSGRGYGSSGRASPPAKAKRKSPQPTK